MFHFNCETQRVKLLTALGWSLLTLSVADVMTATAPTNCRGFCFPLGVDKWPHAVVVKTVWLVEVDDVELVILTALGICHSEVIPLGLLDRASMVILQLTVVFEF